MFIYLFTYFWRGGIYQQNAQLLMNDCGLFLLEWLATKTRESSLGFHLTFSWKWVHSLHNDICEKATAIDRAGI